MEVGGLAVGAIALVPPTLQLIDLCTTFYNEVQHFGRSTQQFNLKFTYLRGRYDSLQRVLFEKGKFPFAPDTLFRILPEQDQRVIYAVLQELARLFYKHYVIGQTYRLKFELPETELPDVEALADALTTSKIDIDSLKPAEKHSSLLSLRHIWWANRGRKKAEKLLAEFEGWLRRIRDVLEDSWWLLPAFEKVPNLSSLEKDDDAIELGVGAAAGLKKLSLDTTKALVNLNLNTITLTVEYLTTHRGIAHLEDKLILVEALSFEPDNDGFIPQTLGRGWLHRGLRSENVICFSPKATQLNHEPLASYFFEHFVISGFDSSRLETDFSLGSYDNVIEKNIYRHPDRWGAPRRTFSRLHDIYALGVMLLEIGLWEKALFIGGNDFTRKPQDAAKTNKELHRQADLRLGHRCGNKFRSIVILCLTGEFPDVLSTDGTIISVGLQSKFRELVVDALYRLHLGI